MQTKKVPEIGTKVYKNNRSYVRVQCTICDKWYLILESDYNARVSKGKSVCCLTCTRTANGRKLAERMNKLKQTDEKLAGLMAPGQFSNTTNYKNSMSILEKQAKITNIKARKEVGEVLASSGLATFFNKLVKRDDINFDYIKAVAAFRQSVDTATNKLLQDDKVLIGFLAACNRKMWGEK